VSEAGLARRIARARVITNDDADRRVPGDLALEQRRQTPGTASQPVVVEAFAVTVTGGLLGSAMGLAIAKGVAAYAGWKTIVTPVVDRASLSPRTCRLPVRSWGFLSWGRWLWRPAREWAKAPRRA